MRVLQINTERTWRGGERQTVYTIEGLIDAGVEVGLICRDGYPLHKAVRDLPVTIHPVRSTVQAFLTCARAARGYDIVHAQSAKGHSIAVYTKPLHRKPVLYTRRVNFALSGPESRLKYQLTDRCVAISTAIRDTLNAFSVEHVDVISSTVRQRNLDPARAHEVLNSMSVPQNTLIIGWIGDLVPQKDPDLLVETVRELAGRRQDFVVLQCGNNQMGQRVRERIKRYELEDRLKLLGHIDDVEDLYSLFDVFLVTGNETEGLNSSVYDAFVYNVPVVSTLTGGMRDSVADRGLTCEHGDAVCLADQIERIFASQELAESMTGRAKQWALDNVSIPAITGRYLDVYHEMLNRSSS